MTITWSRADSVQLEAARMIFDKLHRAGYTARRISDQVEIDRFDRKYDGISFTPPAERPCERMPPAVPTPKQPGRQFNSQRVNLDSVVMRGSEGSTEVVIPAIFGTCYWAILRFMYLNAGRPVSEGELAVGVREIMKNRCPHKWSRLETKGTVKTVIQGKVVEKVAEIWWYRVIRNARNLCRLGCNAAYGQRLVEMGHVLRCETIDGQLFFTLHTKLTEEILAPRKRGRKRKADSVVRANP